MEDLLRNLTIRTFRDGLAAKKFSALEIAQAFFEIIKARDGGIGAYLTLTEDLAARGAEAADLAVAKGDDIGDLAGVPLAVKDAILVAGERATAASKILEHYTAAYDATVIRKLRAEKAVFLGKTNMDEFAMGASTENSAFQITRNPRDPERVPGGSSGGSAAAVAAGLAIAALGSDTGGSIRQPASFCGVVGLNPTYGAVSRNGLIAMTSSMDQIGPITKTVEDAAILFRAIAGRDPMDATTADARYGEELLNPDLRKIKELVVGLPEEYFSGGIAPEVAREMERAIGKLKSLGLRFKPVSLPHTKYGLSCYYIAVPAEVSSNLARFDGIRYARLAGGRADGRGALGELYREQKGRGFGPEAKRRIILGAFVLSSGHYDAYYEKAQRVRTLIARDFDEAFRKADILLTPVAPTPAFKIGEKAADPLSMYLSDVFTIPVKLAGLPAVSIPTKPARALAPGELPVGFQLIGKKWREADLLGAGTFYEQLEN